MMLALLLSTIDNEADRVTVEKLFNQYEHLMLAVAMEILKDKQLAEDAVQDAFISIIKHLQALDYQKNIEALMVKIVKNKAFDIIRKKKRELLAYDTIGERVLQDNTEISNVIEDAEVIEITARMVAMLPPKLSKVFIMYYNDDLSYDEIATLLNISYDAVIKRLQRAKKALGEYMIKGGLA